jgi:hypothetical protein
MRATGIVLRNFRSHQDTHLDLHSPVTIIHGPNAAGKSSVIDAIHLALLGYCRGTDERGAGVKDLIADGEKEAKIGLDMLGESAASDVPAEVPMTIEITPGGARWQLGKGYLPALKARDIIAASLGFDRDALHACLDVHGFLGLHHARQKDLLLKALGLDLSDMDARFEQAKLDRAAAKRTLAALVAPIIPPDPGYTEAEIRDQLAEVRVELEQLIAERGRTAGAAEQAAAEIQSIDARLAGAPSKATAAKARKEADKLRDLLDGLRSAAAALDAKEADLLARNAALCDERSRLEAPPRKTNPAPEEAALLAERSAIAAAAEAVKKMASSHGGENCCLISNLIPCKIDGSGREALTRHFAGMLEKVDARIRTAADAASAAREQRVKVIAGEVDGLLAEIAEIRKGRELSGIPGKEADLRRAEKVLDDFCASEKDRARLAELRAAGFGDSIPPAAGQLDEQIAAARARIQKGEQLAVIARQREAVLRQARDTDEHRLAAESLLEKAEADVLRLGPGGERLQMIAAAVSPMLDTANRVVRCLGLPGVEIAVDPWRIGIPGRDAELLSTSEQMRLALGLQIALARATGIGMIALDGAEILDADGRAGLAEIAAAGLLDQLIICTTTDAEFVPPEIPGVEFVGIGVGDRQPAGVCA